MFDDRLFGASRQLVLENTNSLLRMFRLPYVFIVKILRKHAAVGSNLRLSLTHSAGALPLICARKTLEDTRLASVLEPPVFSGHGTNVGRMTCCFTEKGREGRIGTARRPPWESSRAVCASCDDFLLSLFLFNLFFFVPISPPRNVCVCFAPPSS